MNDQQILTTVGAPPSVYRHQSAARSGLLALIGSTHSIPAGMLPAYGMISVIPVLKFTTPRFEYVYRDWVVAGCLRGNTAVRLSRERISLGDAAFGLMKVL